VFNAICEFFNYLPVAAVVKNSVLCTHSGIPDGTTLESINSIKKPCSPESNKIIADILWSQPSIYKDEYTSNNSSSQYRKLSFSSDVLSKFLIDNKLSMLIRSKDCCISGFERQFNNKMTTIFSATNYCYSLQNDAAIMFIKRNLEMQPKVMTSDEKYNTWNNKKDIISNFPISPKKNVLNV